jgi:hypothetical protein
MDLPDKYDDREVLLLKLNQAIDKLHYKAMKGRVTNPKNEQVRIAWFKALAYACSIYNQIKRDADIEDLQKEVEALQQAIKK